MSNLTLPQAGGARFGVGHNLPLADGFIYAVANERRSRAEVTASAAA